MRIIAGTLKGHLFNDPPSQSYHPMSEKMRGAIFNALGDIEGLTVFDPFAGTGALSLEAISRGAASAQIIEIEKRAFKNLVESVKMLSVGDKVKVTHANAASWSDNNPDTKVDLVLMDPPYDNIKQALLEKMASHAKIGGVVIISHPERTPVELPDGQYELLAHKSHGDGQLAFYRKIS